MATSFSASHEKARNSRQPWRGCTATCLFASHGGYKFGASLGEVTYYFAPLFFWESFQEASEFPGLRILPFGRKSFFLFFLLTSPASGPEAPGLAV